MPYNGAGIFSIINTFVPGTTIASAQMNANFTDIAAGLSDCLTRDGQAPMTDALKLINGALGTPALTFASEPTLGLYRFAAAVLGLAGGLNMSGPLSASAIQVNGNPQIPIGLGPVPFAGTSAPPLWVLANGGALLRTTYPKLWSFANNEISFGNTLWTNGNGTTTFTPPDLRGRVPAGSDNIGGGVGIGRLTATTMSPNGTTFGATNAIVPAQTATIVTANLPPYTPAGTITNGQVLIGGSSTVTIGTQNGVSYAPNAGSNVGAVNGNLNITQQTSTFAGTAAPGQVSTPMNNVQPTIVTNYIIYAGD